MARCGPRRGSDKTRRRGLSLTGRLIYIANTIMIKMSSKREQVNSFFLGINTF